MLAPTFGQNRAHESYDNLFTLNFHHIGNFTSLPDRRYDYAIIEWIPGKSLDEGLVPLISHQDVLSLLKYVPRYKEIEVNEASETGNKGQSLLLDENDVQTGNKDSTSKVDHPPWSFKSLSDSNISEHPKRWSEEFWFRIQLFENDLALGLDVNWQQNPYDGDDEAEENAELFVELDDLLERLPFLNDELKENMVGVNAPVIALEEQLERIKFIVDEEIERPRKRKRENKDESASANGNVCNVPRFDRLLSRETGANDGNARFLSGSNVVVESFKLLKELHDDELEKSREMMKLISETQLQDRLPAVLDGAKVFDKKGIHPSNYRITFRLAENVPKQGGSLEDISSLKRLKTQVFYTLRKKKIKEDNTKSKNQAKYASLLRKYAALQDGVNEG
ncbi:hypothetical protein Tco_0807326 [Tanacetum coccineum]